MERKNKLVSRRPHIREIEAAARTRVLKVRNYHCRIVTLKAIFSV